MGDVTRLPVKFRRRSKLAPRDLWNEDDNVTDLMVHEVCTYLRNLEPCQECPAWEEQNCVGEKFTFKRGCRTLAEEACRVVLAARKKS